MNKNVLKKIALFFCVVVIPVVIIAKPAHNFKFTGLYSRGAQKIPLYYDTTVDLTKSVCSQVEDSVKIGATRTVGTICEDTCRRVSNPDWFLTFVPVKKGKSLSHKAPVSYTTVPMEGEWDKLFWCGWNPELGIKESEIGQSGIANKAELDQANEACKKGKDPNIFFVIGYISQDQCMKDCSKCSIPPAWKK